MSDFRIDQLTLTRNNGRYDLAGECNSDVASTVTVQGVHNAANNIIVFQTPAPNLGGEKIRFTATGLNFATYQADEMMELNFGDQTSPAERRKKGGVVIVDTDYPPPSPNKMLNQILNVGITSEFRVERLAITRRNFNDNEDLFDVEVEVSYDSPTSSYNAHFAQLQADPTYQNTDVIALEFIENNDGGRHTGTHRFTIGDGPMLPMRLSTYQQHGLVLLVKTSGTAWPNVTRKKALFTVL